MRQQQDGLAIRVSRSQDLIAFEGGVHAFACVDILSELIASLNELL